MLKLGDKNISKLYYGDKAISKAYLGEKLVFQAGEPIFLDYIKFDGNSWIDTGITELGGTWSVTASADNSTQLRFLIGNGGQAGQYYGALANGKWGLGTASEEYYFENARTSKMTAEVIFEESQVTATVDGVTLVRPGTRTSGNFLLCGYERYTVSSYLFKGDVYHCSYINVNKELIQDLRPCIDPKGTVCMYDMVTKKYFYNQGTGTLTAGNIIKFVDYIQFDGNSWIDTEYKPNSNSSVKVEYNPYYNAVFSCIMGTQDSTTANRFYAVISATLYRLQLNSSSHSGFWGVSSTSLVTSVNGSFTPTQQKVGLTIDNYNKQISIESDELTNTFDMATYSSSLGTVDCQYSLLLGNRGTTGVPSTTNGYKGEISVLEIREQGQLIQDLRPCIVASQAGFYDMITGKVFTNAGTGTLKAGGEINLANFTILGTATIDNGIVSNLDETSYITTKTNYGLPTASCWSIIFPTIKVNEFSKYFWGANAQYSGIVLAVNSSGKIVVYISSDGAQWDIASGINNLYSNLQFSKGEEVNIRLDFTGSKYVLYILKDNAWQEQTYVISSLKVGYFEHFRIGQWTNYYRFDSTMDLKTFIVVADGKVTSALKN